MRDSDITKGLYVKVKGHVGIVKKCNIEGFCGDKTVYLVEFTGDGELATVSWWVTASEIEQIRGV